MGQVFARFLGIAQPEPPARAKKGMTVVCISDTHGLHRDVVVPTGDILVHAGDFTRFGNVDDAIDFNDWLGELSHKHKIVVFGNHEQGSTRDWIPHLRETFPDFNADTATHAERAARLLSNALFICNETVEIDGVKVFGSDFYWNMKSRNPHHDLIREDVDIVVVHNPPKGFNDGPESFGCPSTRQRMEEVRPRLCVSGHIHSGGGGEVRVASGTLNDCIFVNASVVEGDHRVKRPKAGEPPLAAQFWVRAGRPVVVEI